MRKLLVIAILLATSSIYATSIDIAGGGGGGPGSDTTAIHIDTADEYDTASQDASPESTDRVLVEDGSTKAKEWVEIGDFPTGSGMASFDVSGNVGAIQTITNGNELIILGSDGLTSTASATDTLTIGIDTATNTKITNSNTHISADGSSHTFIDQSVISGASPTFTAANLSDGGSNAIITTTQETNFTTAFTHSSSDGKDHSDVGLNNTHRTSDGSDHGFIDQSVISGSSPTFDGTNFTGIPNGALDETYWTDSSSSTGTNKTINDFTNFVGADELHEKIFNNTGSTLTKGTPVYISGYNVGLDAAQVTKADADTAAAMPAAYIIENDITTGSSGHGILAGAISGMDTSGYSLNDLLYVSTTAGTLTATKPTGATDLVQKVAIVTRVHVTMGRIEVFGAGRSNGIPNQANFPGNVTANLLSDGTISITGGNLTGATGVTATNLTGTLATAAQGNVTSLGTLTTLTVDNMTLNGNTFQADSGALNITPAAGSAIVLDGTVNVDAGVVTGMTALTSTAITGTLQTAAQTNITSVGTLTGLTMGGAINIAGNTITNTGTVTLPTATTTLVGTGTTDTLTNKTINADNNTITNLAHGAEVDQPLTNPHQTINPIIIACSGETATISATTVSTFRMPYDFTISDVRASLKTAPTGSTVSINITESGTTIFAGETEYLSIDNTEKTSTTAANADNVTDTALADDAEIQIIVTKTDSNGVAAGLKVTIIGYGDQ